MTSGHGPPPPSSLSQAVAVLAKRKADTTTDDSRRAKRTKVDSTQRSAPVISEPASERTLEPVSVSVSTSEPVAKSASEPVTKPTTSAPGPSKPGHRIKKLVPPRPFPSVPAGASATGPRSSYPTGKNYIAVTRKTSLGAYLRRCKDVVMKDGYKSLHLHALGAAIPHLTLLATSLPSVLPFDPSEIHTEVLTGTVEVQDELIPDDEDEDISYRTRDKSTLSITITIGDGVDEQDAGGGKWGPRGKRRARGVPPTASAAAPTTEKTTTSNAESMVIG